MADSKLIIVKKNLRDQQINILNKFYEMKSGEGEMSPEECQNLNVEISNLELGDIPSDQRSNVADYLVLALNHHIVKSELKEKLEDLLSNLQETI